MLYVMQCRTPAIRGGIPWARFPVAPILQPELSNPLYMRLVCETLQAKGLDCFPSGWYGIAPAIKAFLEEKERQFAVDYETSVGANIVRGSLLAIARAIADSGDSVLVWSRAQQVVSQEGHKQALYRCYSALITSLDSDVVNTVTSNLNQAFRSDPSAFDNALIRDHIRCTMELAAELDVLPDGCDPELTMQPIDCEWPLDLPSEEEIELWDKLSKLGHSCLDDDFYVYSLNCLRPWEHAVSKDDMEKRILQRVAQGFGYEGSGCERYDRYMLGKYGGGRGKPTWAERIGKKYQWVAMY